MAVDTTRLRGEPEVGYLEKSVAGAVDVSLTYDEAKRRAAKLTGAITANINVVWPLLAENHGRVYYVENATTGAFTVTVKGLLGSGVVVTQGTVVILLWNGADFVAQTAAL